MIPSSSTPSNSPIRPGTAAHSLAALPRDSAVLTPAADRMYQIAALAAGLFLLATLL